jgi:hypothetical protein
MPQARNLREAHAETPPLEKTSKAPQAGDLIGVVDLFCGYGGMWHGDGYSLGRTKFEVVVVVISCG